MSRWGLVGGCVSSSLQACSQRGSWEYSFHPLIPLCHEVSSFPPPYSSIMMSYLITTGPKAAGSDGELIPQIL